MVLFLFLLSFGQNLHAGICSECYLLYKEVLDLQKQYEVEEGYFKFSMTSVLEGLGPETVVSEIWRKGESLRYSSPGFLLVQDEKNQVMIAESGKTIIISPVSGEENSLSSGSAISLLPEDSLSKYFSEITCETRGAAKILRISIRSEFYSAFRMKTILVEFDPIAKKINKGDYEILHQNTWIHQKYNYLEFKKNTGNMLLSPAVSEVFDLNGKPKEKYKNFLIRDLR